MRQVAKNLGEGRGRKSRRGQREFIRDLQEATRAGEGVKTPLDCE
jgi:hypothetical protein